MTMDASTIQNSFRRQ